MLQTKADADSVQQVDVTDEHRQINNLLVGKVCSQSIEYTVRRTIGAKPRQCFGPGEGSTLACGIDGRFMPGRNEVQALRRLPETACILGVFVDTEGALVDLGCYQLHKLNEGLLKPTSLNVALDCHYRFSSGRRDLRIAKALLEHAKVLLGRSADPYYVKNRWFSMKCQDLNIRVGHVSVEPSQSANTRDHGR